MSPSTQTRGLLFVTMQPKETLSPALFHDWYNNEHGPNRTRLSFIPNGFRYQATDLPGIHAGNQSKPEFLAIYDITDMDEITKEPYQYLRAPPGKTQREIDVMAQIWVGRTLFDFLGEKIHDRNFVTLESPDHFQENAEGNVLTTSRYLVDPGQLGQLEDWIQQSVLPKVDQIPGWRRTSWFKHSYLEPRDDGMVDVVVINEFKPSAGADPLAKLDMNSPVSGGKGRTYELFYTFGTASRHLDIVAPWTSPDGLTKTIPGSPFGSAIESTITTRDGAVIPFRLEGSSDPDAPVLVLVNSVLTTYEIWDNFVKHFFSRPQNQKFRILRSLSRGRILTSGASTPVTVDLLASDIISLLDALRIPQAAALVGVSLGGATSLAAALTYPSRITRFVSCDTSAKSPAGNKDTWGQRISVAEKEGKSLRLASEFGDESPTCSPQPVVGEELAELTARRWFVPESYDNPTLVPEILKVKNMISNNSLREFSRGVEALFQYDYTELLPSYQGKGAFLVGAGDGVLPKGMERLSKELGSNGGQPAGFKVIEGAGHLPMVEKPQEVAEFIGDFIAS